MEKSGKISGFEHFMINLPNRIKRYIFHVVRAIAGRQCKVEIRIDMNSNSYALVNKSSEAQLYVTHGSNDTGSRFVGVEHKDFGPV